MNPTSLNSPPPLATALATYLDLIRGDSGDGGALGIFVGKPMVIAGASDAALVLQGTPPAVGISGAETIHTFHPTQAVVHFHFGHLKQLPIHDCSLSCPVAPSLHQIQGESSVASEAKSGIPN